MIIVGVSGLPTLFSKASYGRSALTLILSAGILLPSLFIHPHYLSFYNLAAGGPANGASILADSSNDWGQDLFRLQEWLAENGESSVRLGWFGTADPAHFGLGYEPLPGFPRAEFLRLWVFPPFNPDAPEPGLYAISASSLWETHWPPRDVYGWFREHEPTDQIGYSIYIYDLR